ncbi:MAG: ATP synthase F0 subunit B [Merismopedia sp. SIO2A8]|nr:ATP synthase F0 subunit B [Symploca sp. SIO2B6]NET49567.1 ATP synthase F0 subunit B [Merismopedia sp. SIO2A8]
MEEIVFDSPHIPFTRLTLIDEETLLAQLDLVRENLPDAFDQAEKIVRQREEIILQAEEYAQEIMEAAERRADQMLDELGIIEQAQQEAQQIRQRVQQECETLEEQTFSDIERVRRQAQQEIEHMRQLALTECEDIQNGAYDYANEVLANIDQQLSEMLRVIRNGRQQLQNEPPPGHLPEADSTGTPGVHTSPTTPKHQ